YLFSKYPHGPSMSTGFLPESARNASASKLDALDMKILGHLVDAPLARLSTMSQALEAAQSTLSFRLERLRNTGVISAPLYRLNTSRDILKFKVLIKTAYPSRRFEEKILKLLEFELH